MTDDPYMKARLAHRNKALVKIMHMRAKGEQVSEKMAIEADVKVEILDMLWQYTIPALMRKIIEGKQARTYNRTALVYETGVSGNVIKLVEKELMQGQEIPNFLEKIDHLQSLVLEYCDLQRPMCEFDKVKQHFTFGAYDSSFEYYARQEGMERQKCRKTLSIEEEVVEIFFRQIQYCLWIGPEHCDSERAKLQSYFLTQPFSDPEQVSQILSLMIPKEYKPNALRGSQIRELTPLMTCLYSGQYSRAIDSIMLCKSDILIKDLIDGTVCNSGTQDLRTLEACVGQEAVKDLCGVGGDLTACLNM